MQTNERFTGRALPASVTDMRVNLIGFLGLLGATWWAVGAGRELDVVSTTVVLMLSLALPIVGLDLLLHRVHRRPSTGLDWDAPLQPDAGRLATKAVGVLACLGMVGAVYALAPEYQGSFYARFYTFLWWLGPPVAVLAVPYMVWADGKLVEPQDGYWHLGRGVLGQWSEVDLYKVGDLLRGWVVKGFFVPLMYIYFCDNIGALRRLTEASPDTWLQLFDALWSFGFLVDIVFTTTGYLLTLRVVDTHLRSSQPSMTGWVAALVCYQPFWSLISRQYIAYDNGYMWGEWLANTPALKAVWAVVLLVLLAGFSGSTITFGVRFSNLTNRGVITGGLYRFTKHPAYIAKCTSFWMLFVPFVVQESGFEALRDCTWMVGICAVYWLRARTEEEHLSEDPAYVQYALWMNDHGLFAPLGRLFPVLRYRPPAGRSE
ncbi:MAG: hypothetical protein ACI8PZ_004523 [Myxococcota bacterium]|jgi:hypothetical protein